MALEIVNFLPIVSTRAGGPPAFVGPAARELERRGHTVITIATDLALAPGARPQRTVTPHEIHPAVAASQYSLYPTRFPRRLLYSPQLARASRSLVAQADVIHLHSLWLYPQFAGWRAARSADVPYIVSPHGALDPALGRRGRLRKALTMHAWQKRMLEHARLIHVTTDVEADLFAELAPRVPRHIVPVGVDLHEFDDLPDGSSFRRQHLGSYDGPVVLFLGRITYKKGIALLIDAFARVRREMDCRLVIAGPDDERLTPSLKSRALRAGIEEDVIFVGPMFDEDRRAALASADLWVLASQTENFGIAVIEAMAAGCPVVISPAVNLSSLISSANAGLVVDLDPTAVANAIRAVLSEESLRRRLRDSGRAFASRFELRAIVSELEQMYMRAVTPDRLPEVAGAGQPSRA